MEEDMEMVIEKLVKGRESAIQLQILLQKAIGNHGSVSANQLADQILGSFTDTISVLSSCDSNEVSQIPATTHVGSPISGDRWSEISGECNKRPALKDRRGCYKRRRSTKSWEVVSPTTEDGYGWRKYGQKEILNAKHPRCYYRCTHKADQDCKAVKQVQRMEDDSTMFHTTYFSQHTCKLSLRAPPPLINPNSDPVDLYLLSFESNTTKTNYDQENPKQSSVKEETQSELSDHIPIDWPELAPLDFPGGQFPASRKMGCDQEDVMSSAYSCASTMSNGFGMDFLGTADGAFHSNFYFDFGSI